MLARVCSHELKQLHSHHRYTLEQNKSMCPQVWRKVVGAPSAQLVLCDDLAAGSEAAGAGASGQESKRRSSDPATLRPCVPGSARFARGLAAFSHPSAASAASAVMRGLEELVDLPDRDSRVALWVQEVDESRW